MPRSDPALVLSAFSKAFVAAYDGLCWPQSGLGGSVPVPDLLPGVVPLAELPDPEIPVAVTASLQTAAGINRFRAGMFIQNRQIPHGCGHGNPPGNSRENF
jgi:hypothetical protein